MGSVRGRVVTEDGAAVSDASVVVAEGANPAPDIAAVTGTAGDFVLDGLIGGTYLLRAFGPGGETGETSVSVQADFETSAQIVLRPA